MPTALEQLRQGVGGIKPTSALDMLRQGVTEPLDIFGMQTSTPAFIPPKPPQPPVGVKDVLREVPGVIGQAREAVRKTMALTKAEILAKIQEEEQQTLVPEEAKKRVLEKLGEEAVFAPNLFAVIQKAQTQTPEEFFAEPLPTRVSFDVGILEKIGTKIGASFISRMAKETDTKVIKQLASLAGEVIDDATAKLVGEAKTPTAVKQILDINAQKIAATAAPRVADDIAPDLQPLAQEARKALDLSGQAQRISTSVVPGARARFGQMSSQAEVLFEQARVKAEKVLGKRINRWNEGVKNELTDFYNQAVKGTKEVVPEISEKVKLKEPQITIKPIRTIADEAIKFVKENPDSSLVSKEFRNPRTKELESGPRLFQRIGESIRNGELNLEELPKIVTKYGLSANETARLFEDAATYSCRTLPALSRVEKEIRALLPDIRLPERIPTLWEKFKSGYLVVDNFRRGLLVTQLATAARNAISQTGRYSLGTITDGMNGVIGKITGQKEPFTPFFEDIAAVLRKFSKGNVERFEKVLTKNPIESARLYNTPVGDVALTGKITNTLNAFNRGQEYFFRNLILDAKLNAAAKREGVKIEELGMNEVERAVDEALEWTFSKAPVRGSFGDAIMRTYRAMPPLTLINPFPRFMSNAVKFLYDCSPAGIMSLFNSKTRATIAAGDYNAISKAVIGTSMLGGAVAIRANENLAGEKWYEIKYGDKRIDTRAFAPFSTYLFFAELMVNGSERISGSDWAQAAIGINRVAGTGLALIDLVGQKVDAKNAKNIVNGIVSSYVGGFTVPFVTIKDIIGNFRLEERTVKETKELPIVGGAIGNIPGLNELLPTKYSMFEDKPLQREQSLLRQLTGITLKTKSFIEKELDRMGKDVGDLIPKTGNLEANRIISKQTGVILDQFNEKLNLSEKYQAMGNDEKLEFIKNLVSEAKKEAKGEAASDLAGVVYNELKKVSSEKRKETIIQLKNRGLMTENILDYLMPMLEAQPLAK